MQESILRNMFYKTLFRSIKGTSYRNMRTDTIYIHLRKVLRKDHKIKISTIVLKILC